MGEEMGFRYVASAPFVRSSFHAEESLTHIQKKPDKQPYLHPLLPVLSYYFKRCCGSGLYILHHPPIKIKRLADAHHGQLFYFPKAIKNQVFRSK